MRNVDFDDTVTEKNNKRSGFWFFFFFMILPIAGVILGIVAYQLQNVGLMLLAMPMLLSFFITSGVVIYKAMKAAKESEVSQDDSDEYYEWELKLSEKDILNADENPYQKDAATAFLMILISVFGPLLLAYLLKNSELMFLGLYVKNICNVLPIFFGLYCLIRGWRHLANYFEFQRAKKILTRKHNGEKRPLLFPRVNILSLIFFLFFVLVLIGTFDDINTLHKYQRNGVKVDAVSYHVETEGEDNWVYFRYTYEGTQYIHVAENYPGGTKIGNHVEAYVDPENPDKLFLYYSNAFAVYIMFMLSLFFLWMGNAYRRSILVAGLFTEGIVAMVLGFYAGTLGHKVWGIILLGCALLMWAKGKKAGKTIDA